MRFTVRAVDTAAVARIKGDRRMADVVRNTVVDRVRPPAEDVRVTTTYGDVTLNAPDVRALVNQVLATGRPANESRNLLREQLVELAWSAYREQKAAELSLWSPFGDAVRASASFKAAIDRMWPTLSAAQLIRQLYGNRSRLERASATILDDDERALLIRKSTPRLHDERWTRPDLALLDEAEAVINGAPRRYGHIVIDEAQDLSPMELRMIARRARRQSMTVLGDLAQATAPASQTSWADAAHHLGAASHYSELTVGYRVPAPILDYANRLLPQAAPGVQPPQSARATGIPPRLVAVPDADLRPAAVAEEARDLIQRWNTLAIVTPPSLLAESHSTLDNIGIDYADGQQTAALGDHVTLLLPSNTKGLEFDAVLVIEPTRIVAEHDYGARLLYITLTRAVQQVAIVHAEPLPAALTDTSDAAIAW